MRFPPAIKIGPCSSRWRLSDLEAYEAACAGTEPPKRTSETERYLHVQHVADRYGTSVSSVWRWTKEGADGEAA